MRLSRERLAVVKDSEKTFTDAAKAATRNAGRLRDLATAAKYLTAVYKFGAAARTGEPQFRGVQKAMQQSWKRTRFCEGRHYLGKSDMPPAERDYDDIMPQVNRLAAT